jgi:hypothetical protein
MVAEGRGGRGGLSCSGVSDDGMSVKVERSPGDKRWQQNMVGMDQEDMAGDHACI